jgi:MFS family permease
VKILYAGVIILGSIDFGYTMGFSFPAITKEGCGMRTLRKQSDEFWHWMTSVTSLAAFLGPIFSAYILNRIGRRTLFFVNSVISTVIWLLFFGVTPKSVPFAIVLRALNGICIGIYSALCPLYLVEISPKESTGFFGALNQYGIALGFFFVYIIAYSKVGWHALAGIGAIFPGLASGLIWFVPESTALAADPQADYPAELRPSLFARTYLWKLFVGSLLMIFQQTTGVTLILMYLVNAKENHIPPPGTTCALDKELMFSALASLAQVVACLLGALLIEYVGRRFVLTVSLLAIAVTNAGYAATYLVETAAGEDVRLVLIFVFLLAYGLGAGPVPWFLMPEQFDPPLRAYATSIIACVHWTMAFGFIYLWEEIGGYPRSTAPVFAALSLGGAVFGYFYAPNPQEAARKGQELVRPEELYQELGIDGVPRA